MRTDARTVVGHSATDKVLLYGGLPLVGGLLGYFLPRIADWAVDQRWVPWKWLFELVSDWDMWWAKVILVAAGLVAGLLLGAIAMDDSLRITVTNHDVELLKNEKTTVVARDEVAAVFLDGKELVIQDRDSAELVREKHDQLKGDTAKIGAAFRAHGYPWSDDGDPYADRFRRWVEDDPELPPAVNAVLRARAKASEAADLRELRTEIAKLGYVVRDSDKKQYWRAAAR
ncbi:YqeB family protein [Kribbella sp. CA-253562]|uniref:YqeB family protein n=1 Tax=Kribbella sp. CA-253562 TaxID=3239942 RepID=UPI003D90BB64